MTEELTKLIELLSASDNSIVSLLKNPNYKLSLTERAVDDILYIYGAALFSLKMKRLEMRGLSQLISTLETMAEKEIILLFSLDPLDWEHSKLKGYSIFTDKSANTLLGIVYHDDLIEKKLTNL